VATTVNAAEPSVRSVQRALDLLFRLAEYPEGVSLQRLVAEVGVSKSTAHRLLATLERAGAAEQDIASRAYRLGPRVRRLAAGASGDLLADLRRIALPYMAELRALCGESIALQILDDCWTVVVEQCESPHEVRRVLGIGQRLPVLTGATSTAILSRLPADEVQRILSRTRRPDQPGPDAARLEAVRQAGWAFAFSERVPGGSAIAAPLLGPGGRVLGAMSAQGPSFRFSQEVATSYGPRLAEVASRISATLGAP
jgi:DNA-binding IclR family transcriptional regulator